MAVIPDAPKMFGAYVTNISTSIGWGGQGGSCQLSLVEDPDNGVTIDLPSVGTAAYFNYDGFSFGGVFQRWTYKESLSGRIYDVILESPSKLLDGLQIILDGFQGTQWTTGGSGQTFTTQLNNIYNPFAYRENYAFGGIFGGSDINSAGFPALDLLGLIEGLSKGGGNFGGPAVFGDSEYTIDLTELKASISANARYFRVQGPVQNLNGILQECCEVVQLDYFVTVTGGPDGNGGGVIDEPVLTIKTIDKAQAPSVGVVQSFVDSAKIGGTLVAADNGQEFSSDVTQKLVIGGPATRMVEVFTDNCLAVWGKFLNNTYVIGNVVPASYQATAEVPIALADGTGYSQYTHTVTELRMALAGQESWRAFKTMESEALGTNEPWTSHVAIDEEILNLLAAGEISVKELVDTSAGSASTIYDEQNNALIEGIYNSVKLCADQFYGKKFLAPLPYEAGGIGNNLRWISEDVQYEASWEISDAAFTTIKPVPDVNFYDGDGRLRSYVAWSPNSANDYSGLGGDYAIARTGAISTTKGGPEKDIFWLYGYPYVLCDAGADVQLYDGYTTPDQGVTVLADYLYGIYVPPYRYSAAGKNSGKISIPPDVARPSAFGIPQQSNRYTWGPWYAYGALNGKAEVIVDETMRPETFGGDISMLDNAAFAIAFSGTSAMFASESGYVELVGAPTTNIADRFAGSGPYVTNMDVKIGIDGITTTYKFNTWTPDFGKMAKYNIDRISRINKNTLAFMQRERGKVQKRPFPKQGVQKAEFSKDRSITFPFGKDITNWMNQTFQRKDDGSEHASGGSEPLEIAGGTVQANFTNTGGMTEDSFQQPIEIDKTYQNAQSPGFEEPQLAGGKGEDGKFGGDAKFVGPSVKELNPFFPIILDDDTDGSEYFSIRVPAVVNENAGGTSTNLQTSKLDNPKDVVKVRPLALKGPLMLSSFGFDIADQPVPPRGTDGNDRFKFDEDVAKNLSTWKTGPVHLMWDDERKVWTGGPQIVCGILDSEITEGDIEQPSTFEVKLLRKGDPEKGKELKAMPDGGEIITCYNRDSSLSQKHESDEGESLGVWVIAIRLNYEWIPLWVACQDA